ncbi:MULTISPECIES: GNAT family N-acetyltransferase [unclassified Agarivorans]|uniref:GNAT family N-acetyltransferase n=1 Tax=unclassified Agarivorans TaxID=2636026 RepID=UPI003D7E7B4F
MQIRATTYADFLIFWPSFQKIVSDRQSYAFDPDINIEQAYELWCLSPLKSYVYEENGHILGTYYIKANAMGPGSHVCNCGYMVAELARGKGIAALLCLHSQQVALDLGFKAMQFNSVVSTNEVAVRLWKKLGYQILGTIPQAYLHSDQGYVDSYIMHKLLVPLN